MAVTRISDIPLSYHEVKLQTAAQELRQQPKVIYEQWQEGFISSLYDAPNIGITTSQTQNNAHEISNTVHLMSDSNQRKLASINQQGEYIHIFDHHVWMLPHHAEVAQAYSIAEDGKIIRTIYTRELNQDKILVESETLPDRLEFDQIELAKAMLSNIYGLRYHTYSTQPVLRELRQRLERSIYGDRRKKVVAITSERKQTDSLRTEVTELTLAFNKRTGLTINFDPEGLLLVDYYRNPIWPLKREKRPFATMDRNTGETLSNDENGEDTVDYALQRKRSALLLETLEQINFLDVQYPSEKEAINKLRELLFENLSQYTPEGEDVTDFQAQRAAFEE